MEKIRVGVTGSSGFIGAHVLERLADSRYEAIPFVGDLRKTADIEHFFDEHKGITRLVSLAAQLDGDIAQQLAVNVGALHTLLEVAARHGVENVVHASTGAVYGEPSGPTSREDDVLQPNTLYGLTKLYGEQCVRYQAARHGMKYVILRYPNVYGPGSHSGVIFNFLHAIKEGRAVSLNGTGDQKRDFLYVTDAVEAIYAALEHATENRIVNIASGELHSLQDVLATLKTLGLEFSVTHLPPDPANPLKTLSEDITRAERELGWKPQVSLSDGLKQLL